MMTIGKQPNRMRTSTRPPHPPHASPCPYRLSFDRLSWSYVFLPSHVGPQRLWNAHTAVGLLVNLEEGQQDARRCNRGVVQRMYEPNLAVLVTVADIDAAGLPVVEVRTRMGFAIASL